MGRPHRYGSVQDTPERGVQDVGAIPVDRDFAFVCLPRVGCAPVCLPLELIVFDPCRTTIWHLRLSFWMRPVAKNGRILGTAFRMHRCQKRTHFEFIAKRLRNGYVDGPAASLESK